MSHSKLTKRGNSYYIEQWNPKAKNYILTCVHCGKSGYSPSIEEKGFDDSPEHRVIRAELKKTMSPLSLDELGRCPDCARMMAAKAAKAAKAASAGTVGAGTIGAETTDTGATGAETTGTGTADAGAETASTVEASKAEIAKAPGAAKAPGTAKTDAPDGTTIPPTPGESLQAIPTECDFTKKFILEQESTYATALAEIRAGRKRNHWMWYIFPQLRGLGESTKSYYFGIADLKQARAYLANPELSAHLIEISQALLDLEETDPEKIFGVTDAKKLCSSMTLFSLVSEDGSVFHRVLQRYFGGVPDDKTLEFLRKCGD